MPSSIPFEIFAQAVPHQVWSATADGLLDWFNEKVFTYSGLSFDDLAGEKWACIVHPDDIDTAVQGWSRALSDGAPYETEFRLKRHDGVFHWHLARATPIKNGKGGITRWVGTNTDIHDQKTAHALEHLLSRELEHRIKNTMAVVGAIARQSFKSAKSKEEAEAVLNGRLKALAEAHDILNRASWIHTTMAAVVDRALASVHSGDSNIRIHGPAVELTPKRALSLAMALHELATNATKYGSLSSPNGQLDIDWVIQSTLGQKQLSFEWKESGGPPVSAPTRRGFGSQLIEKTLAADFGHAVNVEYLPAGLVCKFTAPLNSEEES